MKKAQWFLFLVAMLLMSCGTLEFGIERRPDSTNTPFIFQTEAPSPTTTSVQPSKPTTVVEPKETLPLPKPTLESPPPTPGQQSITVSMYLIAVDDNGQSGPLVGCGDSVIPVQVETPTTKEVLRASLEALLSMKDQFYGESGLYNALYQSDLQLDRITLENGVAEIFLTGTLMLGGVCDNPRVEAQLQSTVLQFSTIQEATIYINGKPLKEALSLQG
jgi:hypothetical protein